MLDTHMMQEIIDLKLIGLTVSEIAEHLRNRDGKAPSLPTIRKYYAMDSVSSDVTIRLAKDKAFDVEPFKTVIPQIVEANPNCQISSVYDVLEERYVESGLYPALPANQQTLRNYIHFLKESGVIDISSTNKRTYDHVFDTPPGQQCLIDFGQEKVSGGLTVHYIALLLRYSRLLGVYAQDHVFNSEEAAGAIYRFFVKCGGRPSELVIDQDSVFVASETYDEVVMTATFEQFCKEQDIRLWVCNKSDPESKGGVENLVGFVKKNYFSARAITTIEEVFRTLPGWAKRKNARIHQATYHVPEKVFKETEQPALRPLLPSLYESAPVNLVRMKVGSMPYINFKSSKYSVPRDCCFSSVYHKAIADKLHIYSEERTFICTHVINPCKGSFNQLPEHVREPSTEWMEIAERLRKKYNCFDFQHLINGFKKENPRHPAKQLGALEEFLEHEDADRLLVAEVMRECCKHYRYRISQFKVVYEQVKKGRVHTEAIRFSDVEQAELAFYQEAFDERCVG